MRAIPIAIIGYGKIARDQHAPAIAGIPRFRLAAVVTTQGGGPEEVRCFRDYREMLASMPELEAVAIATPPGVRYDIARACLAAGKHVLIEKPPGVTLGEVEALADLARERTLTLFTTWHARENEAVAAAAALLTGAGVAGMTITWHEDVRKWHPGQQWIWEFGGFGVFDPGINALSIATRIFPGKLLVRDATLYVPGNRSMPIAAELGLAGGNGDARYAMSADWRHSGDEAWTIDLRLADGRHVALTDGGNRLVVDGEEKVRGQGDEYPRLYRRFLDLIDERDSEVDIAPLRIVADTFLMGKRVIVEPFED